MGTTNESFDEGVERGLSEYAKGVEARRKILDWFEKNVGSHLILDSTAAAEEFERVTGLKATWPSHSAEATKAAIEGRGLGGTLAKEPAERLAYGYEMAEGIASSYAPEWTGSPFEGRGRRYSYALEQIARGLEPAK
jgi:hypothetical protein